jgi:hypothetical protein
MITKAQSSLGYLKIVTPKKRIVGETQAGRTKMIFGDGDGKVGRKAMSNWTGR